MMAMPAFWICFNQQNKIRHAYPLGGRVQACGKNVNKKSNFYLRPLDECIRNHLGVAIASSSVWPIIKY